MGGSGASAVRRSRPARAFRCRPLRTGPGALRSARRPYADDIAMAQSDVAQCKRVEPGNLAGRQSMAGTAVEGGRDPPDRILSGRGGLTDHEG